MGTEADVARLKNKLNHMGMLATLMRDLSTLNVAG